MTNEKSSRALSAAEFRDLARSYMPEAVKALRELVHSTDPSIAAEARRLLARTEAQGDIHPSDTSEAVNSIRRNQDASGR